MSDITHNLLGQRYNITITDMHYTLHRSPVYIQ